MLIIFLNHLYKKPIEYQLFWLYILGQIDDGNTSVINLKKLKKKYNYNKHTFYRILRFGLNFFNSDNNGVSIELTKQSLIINVVRNRKVKINENNEKINEKINEVINDKNNEKTIKVINEKINEKINEVINEKANEKLSKKIIEENNGKIIKVIKKKTIKKPIKLNNDLIKIVIDYLNEKTSKNFTVNNKQTIAFIGARVNDGYSQKDFIKVIDIKTSKWLNSEMADYLRPQTLFSQKMESYLNEINNKNKSNERFTKTQSAVDQAKQVDWFNTK